jgi:GxxExxY protein
MDIDKHGFKHSEITEKIIRAFYEVYNELGHGFLESVYERSLEIALNSLGLKVCRQIQVPVWFRGQPVGDFTADMLIEGCVLLELKAARALDSSHQAQLLNYLRATEIEVGYYSTSDSSQSSSDLSLTILGRHCVGIPASR